MRLRIVLVACAALALSVGVVSASAGGGNSDFAHLCQKDGYKKLAREDGTSFKNAGDCVSYGAQGGKLKQTISFGSTAPSPGVVGHTYTPTATATSGLKVLITVAGSSSSVCSIDSGGVVTFIGGGTCELDANQAGNDTWAAAEEQQSITVSPGADISLSYSYPTVTVSNAGPLAATVRVGVSYDLSCGATQGWSSDDWFYSATIGYTTAYVEFTSQSLIPAGQSLTFTFYCTSAPAASAEVVASSEPDPDSTPNNHVTTEDDYVVMSPEPCSPASSYELRPRAQVLRSAFDRLAAAGHKGMASTPSTPSVGC